MGFVKEFKEFALKGNVMDMAIGIIIGAAFGTIIQSMIGDIIMPVVGMAGKADFSNQYLALNSTVSQAVQAAGDKGLSLIEARKVGPVLAYGAFITVVINFLILAFCVFMMVKMMNRLKRNPPPVPSQPVPLTKDQVLLTEIRDAMRAR
jgi:large conductance mechanosensitive channel